MTTLEDIEKAKAASAASERKVNMLMKRLLREIGQSVTKDMLNGAVWKVRAAMHIYDELLLEAKRSDLPTLDALTKDVKDIWSPIEIMANGEKFNLISGDSDTFRLAPDFRRSRSERKGRIDLLLPIVKKFGLRLDFTEIEEVYDEEEKLLNLFKDTINSLRNSQH
jgi:hypothetical protein